MIGVAVHPSVHPVFAQNYKSVVLQIYCRHNAEGLHTRITETLTGLMTA